MSRFVIHSDDHPHLAEGFWVDNTEGKPLEGPFADEDAAEEARNPNCRECGGSGREYRSAHGGNDPNVWDAGPCPHCRDSGLYRDMRPTRFGI